MSLVSIIIPAFDAGRFINRALNGVLSQTHAGWELIVVEDGTHDDTEALVRAFAARVTQSVRYENNGTNLGVSAARNRAMALATGETIAFLDADDWWTPEHLSSGLETLERGAGFCFSGFHIFDEPSQTVMESLTPGLPPGGDVVESLFKSNFIQTSSLVMLSRKAALNGGNFDTKLKVGEDCDYWMRVLAHGATPACTQKQTCYYTKHGASAMAKTLMVAEHGVKFYRKHLQSDFLQKSLRGSLYARSLWIYGRLLQRQNPALARSLFLEAWRTRPMELRYLAYALAAAGLMLLRRDSSVP